MGRARVASILIALVTVVVACAPAETGRVQPNAAEKPAAARKVVTMADAYEPKAITETFVVGKQTTGNNVRPIVHDNLFKNPEFQTYEPQLAVEIPSIEKGSWKVNGDGTMETIWRLRP